MNIDLGSSSDSKMSMIPGETIKKTGRPPREVEYKDVTIDNFPCVIGTILHNGSPLEFIIDKEDEKKVRSRHWYAIVSGKYIGHHITIEGSKKMLMLHNFVMDRFVFPGKGAKESIDHINRNGLDNRKSNLRLVTQSIQNTNQKKKARTAELPEGFTDLPKHIWYIKAHGAHGDRFCVEIKTERIARKTTSSKKVSIQEKFQEASKIRDELYAMYPYLRHDEQ
jgi:hypothetical protein